LLLDERQSSQDKERSRPEAVAYLIYPLEFDEAVDIIVNAKPKKSNGKTEKNPGEKGRKGSQR
jgi:hypothetical protein